MKKTLSDFSLSRRSLLRAVGAAAVAGLPSCGSDTGGQPASTELPANISDGYTDQQSYRPGHLVTLFMNTQFPNTSKNIQLSTYGGRPVLEFPAELFTQAALGPTPWETGFGYQPNASFVLPDLPSGVYQIERLIPVIVKTAPMQQADVVIVFPTNTMAAYGTAGGKSMYSQVPAPIVSFHRPMAPNNNGSFFQSFLRWFSSVGLPYSFRYIADIDLDDYNEISGAKLLVTIGHTEYWTRQARENLDQFVLGGGNALLLSGNNMWWQVRYSDDRSQMICYKLAHDPINDPLLETIHWTDRSLHYPILPSIGADRVYGGFNTAGFRVLLPHSPVFRGIAVQSGDLISIQTTECDGAPLLNNPVTVGEPRLNLSALGVYRAEIIGYGPCYQNESGETTPDSVATWIAIQRTATSGVVINGASTNWCSNTGVAGKDAERVRKIILNMINLLANHQPVFVS